MSQNLSQYPREIRITSDDRVILHPTNTNRLPPKKPRTSRGIFRKIFILSALLGGVAMAGVGGWFFLERFLEEKGSPEDLPVIRAPAEPYKVKPATPDALEIPHQDKTIYSQLSGKPAEDKVKHLLADPEDPKAIPPQLPEDFIEGLAADPETDLLSEAPSPFVEDQKSSSEALPSPQKPEKPEESPAEAPPAPSVPQASVAPPEDIAGKILEELAQESEKALSSDKKTASPKNQTPEVLEKNFFLQLASSRHKNLILREKERLTTHTRIKKVIRGIPLEINTLASENSQDTVWRLTLGPMTKDQAEKVAAHLKTENVNSLLKKR